MGHMGKGRPMPHFLGSADPSGGWPVFVYNMFLFGLRGAGQPMYAPPLFSITCMCPKLLKPKENANYTRLVFFFQE